MNSKYNDNADLIVGLLKIVVVVAVFVFIIWLVGQYKIEKGQGAILTTYNGDKVAITEFGWKWRIPGLEGVDTYSTVNNRLYFPQDLIEIEQKFQGDKQTGSIGYDIKTSDNKIVDTGGMVQFTVVDLVQFGVMNTNPMEQLQKAVDGEFFKVLQSKNSSSDAIINNQGVEEDAILRGLQNSGIQEQYGVKFTKVQLIRPTYTKDALDALSKKQAAIELSEGELTAAVNKANATRTIADAQDYQAKLLQKYPPYVLNYNSNMELIKVLGDKDRKDATLYYIQPSTITSGSESTQPSVVLPSPKNQ